MNAIWEEYRSLQADGSEEARLKLSLITGFLGNLDISKMYQKNLGNLVEHSDIVPFIERIIPFCNANRPVVDNYNRAKHLAELLRISITAQYVKGKKVLEVGCGSGDLSVLISMKGHDIYGVDINPYAIDLCREKASNYNLQNAKFLTGSLGELQGFEGHFDSLVLVEVLEHVQNPKEFIRETLKFIKKSGRLIVSVPNGYRIPDSDHKNIFTKQSLESLMQSLDLDGEMFWINEMPNNWLMFCLDFDSFPIKQSATECKEKRDHFFQNFNKQISKRPLVSVLLPTYNREQWIGESIKSILNQTYGNLELIIIDDASTDKTRSIVRSYLEKDARITYTRQDTNKGKPAAVNRGLHIANGEYVWIFDDDDIAFPNKLQTQIDIMERYPNASLSHTDAILFDNNTRKVYNYFRAQEVSGNRLWEWLFGCRIHGPSVVMRKKCFEDIGGMDERLIRAQDYDLWIRLLAKYPEAIAINIATIYYRTHYELRGKEKERFGVEKLRQKTLEYEKIIFKKVYNEIPLTRLFPEIEKYSDHPSVIFECLLQRAYSMACRGLYRETKCDLFEALDNMQNIVATDRTSKFLNELIKVVGQWEDIDFSKQVLGIVERVIKRLQICST